MIEKADKIFNKLSKDNSVNSIAQIKPEDIETLIHSKFL